MERWLFLVAGGAAGTLSRFFISQLVAARFGTAFPFGTLVVNLSGCFLVGFLSVLAEEKSVLGPRAVLFLMAGFCGAYTTFSAFMLETSHLMRDGGTAVALWNVLASVVLGFFIFRLGVLVGEVF